MNCYEAERLLQGYMDGELDLLRSLELEDHLHHCLACEQQHRRLQMVREWLSPARRAIDTPSHLRRHVQERLRRENSIRSSTKRPFWYTLGIAAALFVLIISLAGSLLYIRQLPSGGDPLSHEVVASHIRSLMANHLVDVTSSDQHTVRPWFDGKLDFAVPVADLASQGYPLIGGRLDYLDGRTVAALAYRHGKHIINVFIWPATPSDEQNMTQQGYQIITWYKNGMTYWAVSDLNPTDLRMLVRLLQAS